MKGSNLIVFLVFALTMIEEYRHFMKYVEIVELSKKRIYIAKQIGRGNKNNLKNFFAILTAWAGRYIRGPPSFSHLFFGIIQALLFSGCTD